MKPRAHARRPGRSVVILLACLLSAGFQSCSRPPERPGPEEARRAYEAVVKPQQEDAASEEAGSSGLFPGIGDLMRRLGAWISEHRISLLIALAVILLGGIGFAMAGRLRSRERGRAAMRAARERTTEEKAPGPGPGASLVAVAEERAGAGDFSGAALALHLAILGILLDKGFLARGRSYGNREIASFLRRRGLGRDEFSSLARFAESVTFGRRLLSFADWIEAKRAFLSLQGDIA